MELLGEAYSLIIFAYICAIVEQQHAYEQLTSLFIQTGMHIPHSSFVWVVSFVASSEKVASVLSCLDTYCQRKRLKSHAVRQCCVSESTSAECQWKAPPWTSCAIKPADWKFPMNFIRWKSSQKEILWCHISVSPPRCKGVSVSFFFFLLRVSVGFFHRESRVLQMGFGLIFDNFASVFALFYIVLVPGTLQKQCKSVQGFRAPVQQTLCGHGASSASWKLDKVFPQKR